MASSSQRILMIMLLINVMISFAFAISQAPRAWDSGTLSTITNLGTETEGTLNEQGTTGVPDSLQEQGTFLNVWRMGKMIFRSFAIGFVWLPVSAGMFDNPLEAAIGSMLFLFQSLTVVLLALELYQLIWGRKT